MMFVPEPIVESVGTNPRKRIWHVAAEEVFDRRISERARAQELQRSRVQVAIDFDVASPIANVSRLNHKSRRQFSLDTKLPALHFRDFRIRIEERNRVADVCLETKTGSNGFLNAIRERVRQIIDDCESVSADGDERRILTEAGLVDVATALAQEAVVLTVTTANHRLAVFSYLISKTKARHEVASSACQ